ncbi:MAG: hypothetical protein ACRCU1_18445 [Alsobacter sp.]|jgi:hypothetical protein|nr:hypothetical protein [Burkholderiales bacterium]
MRGAGGTSGGLGEFLFGFVLTVAGGYMILSRITVWSGLGSFWGFSPFGMSLVPVLGGIALLFFNGGSKLGWFLLGGGLVIIFAAVIMNLQVYFAATSLFSAILMFGMLVGGLGLIARSLRAHL